MDQNISGRPARPQQVQRPAAGAQYQQPVRPQVIPPKKRNIWPIVAAVVVALVVAGHIAWQFMGAGAARPSNDRYQAVFLDNGQVFFGKLKNTSGQYLRLEGAYYSKKQDIPVDATEEQKAAVNNNVSLAKVGNEVYGPESTVQIRSEQVLFWQDLKSDSKVSKAIDDASEE